MSHELPSFLIDAGELLQHVSRVVYRGSPLYYGRSSTNRYDDPAQAYGVLYLGRDLPTALMESVFHKHQWLADTKRSIALKEVQSRMVRAVGVMDDVLLADLTAPGVMAGVDPGADEGSDGFNGEALLDELLAEGGGSEGGK